MTKEYGGIIPSPSKTPIVILGGCGYTFNKKQQEQILKLLKSDEK